MKYAPKDLKIYDRAAKGELPPSFAPTAQTIQLPESPDFLLVGDDVINDYEGARNAGLQAILLGTENHQLGGERTCIRQLRELL